MKEEEWWCEFTRCDELAGKARQAMIGGGGANKRSDHASRAGALPSCSDDA